jgi:hypothetical protein
MPTLPRALLGVLYPHSLAALAFVHAQRTAGSGVRDFVRKSGRRPTTTNNFEGCGGYFQGGCDGHLRSALGRERNGVSLSPINAGTKR